MSEEKQTKEVVPFRVKLERALLITKITIYGVLALAVMLTYKFRDPLYLAWRDTWTVERVLTPEQKSAEQLIEEIAPKHGLPPLLVKAVVQHESMWRADALKHEPHHMSRCSEFANPAQRAMCASSHGLMQIMFSVHKKNCDLESWTDLYNPRTNIECGSKILAQCAERHAGAPKHDRLRRILGCYNGDPVAYPPKVFAELGSIVAGDLELGERVQEEVTVAKAEPIPWYERLGENVVNNVIVAMR